MQRVERLLSQIETPEDKEMALKSAKIKRIETNDDDDDSDDDSDDQHNHKKKRVIGRERNLNVEHDDQTALIEDI